MSTDWESIISVNFDDLNDEKAELLYDQLIEINPDDENDINRLRHAFKAAKCVMQVKALQADVAVEELEEYIKKNNRNELETLRKQVELYKSTLTNQHGEDTINRMEEYQNQISELKESLETKNNELLRSKRRTNDLDKKLQINEKEIKSLQDEIESLKEEIETQRTGLQETLAETQEPLEKLMEKNKQIQSLLERLDLMERANIDLARQVKVLKDQLESATSVIRSSADEMDQLRAQCSDIQEMNEMLLKEKEYLLKELESLRNELTRYHQQEETVSSKLNEKLGNLMTSLKTKEDQVEELNNRLNQLGSEGSDSTNEKSSLMKTLQIKSQQIDYLKGQLDEAVREIETQNRLIEKLMKGEKQNLNQETVTPTPSESNILTDQINDMKEKIERLEEELKAKDEELTQVTLMKTAYERGEYGLAEALNEVKSLKKLLLGKERRLEEMVQELNQLNLKLNIYEDQLDYLREMAKLNGLSQSDQQQFFSGVVDQSQNERLKILRLQQTIVKLEDEKISLREKLREAKTMATLSGHDLKADEERGKLLAHLKSLQDENLELQLGMKEILIGLRESDSQSDVVIDCPSLERLINLLEGRSLSADLTNVIALKAELDLVRGHNHQLRVDLKRLRHEHLKLIGEYTNEILDKRCKSPRRPMRSDKRTANGSSWPDESSDDSITTTTSETTDETVQFDGDQQSNGMTGRGANELSEGEILIDSASLRKDESSTREDITTNEALCDDDDDETIIAQDDVANGDDEAGDDRQDENHQEAHEEDTPPRPMPRKLRLEKEVQTELSFDHPFIHNHHVTREDKAEQTDRQTLKEACVKCPKLLKVVADLKDQIERTEEHYNHEIKILHKENEWLQDHIQSWKEKYSHIILQKDEMLIKFAQESKALPVDSQQGDDGEGSNRQISNRSRVNKTIPKVLETIINCLQKRLDQKESAIQEYQALMRQTHENYEKEMQKLLEDQGKSSKILQVDPVSLGKMVESDELRTALETCLQELEKSKLKIDELRQELEKERIKSNRLQDQLGRTKLKLNQRPRAKSLTMNY